MPRFKPDLTHISRRRLFNVEKDFPIRKIPLQASLNSDSSRQASVSESLTAYAESLQGRES